jgi:uncharacterized damage-inducible protein DinB
MFLIRRKFVLLKNYNMKKLNSYILLDILKEDVREIILKAEKLKALERWILEKTPGEGKWSVAQVLEHLNIYNRHYLTEIENQLHHKNPVNKNDFKPGWLGDYFTRLMKPGEKGKIKKMKAPANAVPATQPNAIEMLNEFIMYQHQLLNLLNIARCADLNKNRIATTLSKHIKLKLGDTFRFVIAHEQRHFIQIENTTNQVKKSQVIPHTA